MFGVIDETVGVGQRTVKRLPPVPTVPQPLVTCTYHNPVAVPKGMFTVQLICVELIYVTPVAIMSLSSDFLSLTPRLPPE